MAIFFCVAGGPFGLESLVQESGATLAIVLIVATPFLWAVPAALMTAELSSALPNEGGYYVWVRRAFGPFLGFQCAWWTWVYSWIDVAIYPVQFTEYLGAIADLLHLPHPWSEGHPWLKWLLGLVVILPCTWLNVRGAKPVGKAALTFGLMLLAPFVLLVLVGAGSISKLPSIPGDAHAVRHALGSGLFIVLWNYLGWDSMSTIAEEVEQPQRVFPRALALTLPIIVASYLLPVWVGLGALPHPQDWSEGSWPTIAAKVGGPVLAILVAFAAILGQAGQFMSNLLGISRAPMALAQQSELPPFLARLHPRYGTPVAAILFSAAIYTILSFQTFQDLVKFDVLIYSSGLILELAALLWLRWKEPELPRPYRIPGGWPVLILLVLGPLGMIGFAALHAFRTEEHPMLQTAILAAALITGPVAFGLGRLMNRATPA